MDTGQAFLLLETAATIFMAGVLWTIQLLSYPLQGRQHGAPADGFDQRTLSLLVRSNWIRVAAWSAAGAAALWIFQQVLMP